MSTAFRIPTLPSSPWFPALAIVAAIACAAALALAHLRSAAISLERRELLLLCQALTDETDRGLQGAEEGLDAMRAELRDGRLPLRTADSRRTLKTRADLMPLVETLWLVDENWAPVASSDSTPPPPPSVLGSGRARPGGEAMVVGRTFRAGPPGESRVMLALRYEAPAERAAGWIVAAVPESALLGSFGTGVPFADVRMAIYRTDGTRLAGRLESVGPARGTADAPALEALRTTELLGFPDGSRRLVGLHDTPHYGVSVVLTRDLRGVLEGWRYTVLLTTAGLFVLLGSIFGAVLLLRRADQRRRDAQAALQRQLWRAGRLESLGTLAGGVAHDFNNVLGAIVGFGEMARDAAAEDSPQARQLDRLLQAALRGKALVERVLIFGRGGARRSVVFELVPVVEEVLTMLSASLPPGVVLERDLEAADARVRGDPTQAFEAVMNLCTNAMQAMPAGGLLAVRVRRQTVGRPLVLSHSPLPPARYVVLSISDQGTGMTPETMERIFEPFFTTKRSDRGTGFGLAVVHGVVAEFGGAIDVASVPGDGTRFTIYLPESTETADAAAAPAAEHIPRGAGQRLMVVDDEPALIALAEELLRSLGYDAVCFLRSADALAALREAPSTWAALITDEIMPAPTGTQLAAEVRSFAPGLPILLVSGYGGAALAARARAAGISIVLAKPLRRADLARALHRLLGASGQEGPRHREELH
jgi:signal transduction histidine kinase/ActR/RegA family two-component response regulator